MDHKFTLHRAGRAKGSYYRKDFIGDVLYYCFPKTKGDFVAKTRLATEELYKIVMEEKHRKKEEKRLSRLFFGRKMSMMINKNPN